MQDCADVQQGDSVNMQQHESAAAEPEVSSSLPGSHNFAFACRVVISVTHQVLGTNFYGFVHILSTSNTYPHCQETLQDLQRVLED